MEIHRPQTQQDLDALKCWYADRLLMVGVAVPVLVLFLTFLSYLLLTGGMELRSYICTLRVVPTELKNTLTILDTFSASSILLNSGFILCMIGMVQQAFRPMAKGCVSSESDGFRNNAVWWGIQDFLIRDNSDVKYLRRKLNIYRYWQTKYPEVMRVSSFLFCLVPFLLVLNLTLCILNPPSVLIWLNFPVVALVVYLLRLLTDNSLLLSCFYISTYKKILPQTVDDEGDENPFADGDCEADMHEILEELLEQCEDTEVEVSTYTDFAEPIDIRHLFGNTPTTQHCDEPMQDIDDMDAPDAWFGADDSMADLGEEDE